MFDWLGGVGLWVFGFGWVLVGMSELFGLWLVWFVLFVFVTFDASKRLFGLWVIVMA